MKAVVAVSAPLDLVATAEWIARPRNRFYERWLLGRLRCETEPLWRDAPAPVRAAVQGARHIRDFDDAFTAKEAGYRDAADYYTTCSPVRGMGALRIPALLVHADDDPWVPPPSVVERAPLRVVVTRGGGHVGVSRKSEPDALVRGCRRGVRAGGNVTKLSFSSPVWDIAALPSRRGGAT